RMAGRDPLLDRDVGEQRATALLLASHQRMGSCPILAEGAGFFSELLAAKTEDAGWQQGQNPVVGVVFGIASEASVVLYGSIYHRSPRYKSLIPNPQASYQT
ncbi:MAG: hypothetical protein NTV57_06185, partial [Cyanobacteria bacterium]|nr:hypothetical protein [Cyanobacteriota bacterium]